MLPDYEVIGRRIKKCRVENRLTQEQLADILDISVAYISRIERGLAQINLKRITELAEIFKVSPSYLITGSNVKAKDYLKEDFNDVLNRCNPEQQKLIYNISELICNTEFLRDGMY